MFSKIKQNNSGFTLIEMVVAVALFTATMLSAVQIFQMAINSQRNAIAGQNIQESMRYALEVMSKEMRTALKDKPEPDQCPNVKNHFVYDAELTNDELDIKNYNEECVKYYLDNDINGISRLKIKRDDRTNPVKLYFITPDEIEASNLEFIVVNGKFTDGPPLVMMKLDIQAIGKAMHQQPIKIQTAIASRYYE